MFPTLAGKLALRLPANLPYACRQTCPTLAGKLGLHLPASVPYACHVSWCVCSCSSQASSGLGQGGLQANYQKVCRLTTEQLLPKPTGKIAANYLESCRQTTKRFAGKQLGGLPANYWAVCQQTTRRFARKLPRAVCQQSSWEAPMFAGNLPGEGPTCAGKLTWGSHTFAGKWFLASVCIYKASVGTRSFSTFSLDSIVD